MSEEKTIDNPAPEYSSKSDFSKAEVVRLQITKCNIIRSQEMREGYFNYDQMGNKVYIPDARQEWISGVKSLRFILHPEISRDNNTKKTLEELDKKIKEAIERWGINQRIVDGLNVIIMNQSKKTIPRCDQPIPIKMVSQNTMSTSTYSVQYVPGYFNDNFHGYWNEMVEIFDDMFSELNSLIDRCNYFKQQVSY